MTGCEYSFGRKTTCVPTTNGPDQLFDLIGTAGGVCGTPTFTPTPTSTGLYISPSATPTPTSTVAVTPTPIVTLNFDVNSTDDIQDAAPGDHICADVTGMCTLRAAITESNAFQYSITTINLPAGTYTTTLTGAPEDANASGDFDVNSHITIHGAGSGVTIIQASDTPDTASERVIHCLTSNAIELDGLTIKNGRELSSSVGGGGMLFQSPQYSSDLHLTLNDVVITNNVSQTRGGGMRILDRGNATVTINNSVISNNIASSGISGSDAIGGGLDIDGGVWLGGSYIQINNTTMTGNTAQTSTASAYGGGMNLSAYFTQLRLVGCQITDNHANATGSGHGYGGGINVTQSHMDAIQSQITGNSALTSGGALRIASLGTELNGTVGVETSTISNNTAGSGGGVAILNGELVADLSTISGNTAAAEFGLGGGIYNDGTFVTYVAVNTSTVSGNSAWAGGGLYNDGTQANIYAFSSTIANNTAANAGGGYFEGVAPNSFVELERSVFADNSSPTGPDLFGTMRSADYNHIEDIRDAGFVPAGHDVIGIDPLIGPLADNGGPTLTHLPLNGSPLIDTIPPDIGCSNFHSDQRLLRRLVGIGCDKGSVEIQATPTATPTGSPFCWPDDYHIAQIGGAIVPGETDTGNHGDDIMTAVTIPFSFSLYDMSFSTVFVSSNGNARVCNSLF